MATVGGLAVRGQAADVVAVPMRDEHDADRVGFDPGPAQVRDQLPVRAAAAGVDQDAFAADLQQDRVEVVHGVRGGHGVLGEGRGELGLPVGVGAPGGQHGGHLVAGQGQAGTEFGRPGAGFVDDEYA